MRNLLPHGPATAGKSAGAGGAKAPSASTIHDPAIRRRWQLHRHAAGLLADKTEAVDRYGKPTVHFEYRVAMCHRGTDGGGVAVKRSPDRSQARFGNLQTCGSVWHCPICAPKVAAVRRDEMNEAIAAWKARGGDVYFVTTTMQHNADRYGAGMLDAALGDLSAALSRHKASRGYRSALESAGAVGSIRALEVTYGELNGWHVHTHELLFAQPGQLRALRRLVKPWVRMLIKRDMAGLLPGDIGAEKIRKLRALLRRALTVQPGDYAADYVAKFGREPEGERGAWGLASELTRAHMKRGRAAAGTDGVPQRCDHATPWGLLNDALDGDHRSGGLFREYAVHFKGRRQLFWSPKLRQLFFGLVERSDEAIAADPDTQCTEHVIELVPSQWAVVIANEARFDVLRAAATEGAEGVRRLLAELESKPPPRSGYFNEGRYAPRPMTTYQTEKGRAVYVER